jgi:MFS family permease
VRLKSTGRKIIIGLIISLSALMFGYSIKEITSVNIDVLVSEYGIGMDKLIAQSILIGILPLAAIIGAIITRVLIRKFKRLLGIYIFTFINIGAIGLVNVNFFYTLLLGRFIEGICIGFYSAIAPIYLKEIAPK